jgi:hypothetical protein
MHVRTSHSSPTATEMQLRVWYNDDHEQGRLQLPLLLPPIMSALRVGLAGLALRACRRLESPVTARLSPSNCKSARRPHQ